MAEKCFEKKSREVVILTCTHANQPTVSLPVDAYEVSSEIPQLVIVYSQEKISQSKPKTDAKICKHEPEKYQFCHGI